jgi:hypothetical protein
VTGTETGTETDNDTLARKFGKINTQNLKRRKTVGKSLRFRGMFYFRGIGQSFVSDEVPNAEILATFRFV